VNAKEENLRRVQSFESSFIVPPNQIERQKHLDTVLSTKVPNSAQELLGWDTALLVICSNRPQYLERSLSYVIDYHPGESLPIFISEDGKSDQVFDVIQKARIKLEARGLTSVPLTHILHPTTGEYYPDGYYKLATHFKWALTQVFNSKNIKRVIILEEDLQIAPDFFEFFASTLTMLDNDNTLLTASAWNDNGMKSLVKDSKQLYRSDFFPGLGWLMTRKLWEELVPKWPKAVIYNIISRVTCILLTVVYFFVYVLFLVEDSSINVRVSLLFSLATTATVMLINSMTCNKRF